MSHLTEVQLRRAQAIAAEKDCALEEAIKIVQQDETRRPDGVLEETDLPRLRARRTKAKGPK